MEGSLAATPPAVNHLPHPPILAGRFSGQIVVLDDDRHGWNHAQDNLLIREVLLVVEPVIDRKGLPTSAWQEQAGWSAKYGWSGCWSWQNVFALVKGPCPWNNSKHY